MSSRRVSLVVGVLLLGVGLVVGFVEVLEKRFTEGDIYPYYASFRSDPLGTSAYYETLSGLSGYEVNRNLTHLNSLTEVTADHVILLLGYPRDNLSDLRLKEDSSLIEAVRNGGRLVLTLNPELVPEKFRPSRSEDEQDWLERRRALREKRLKESSEDSESENDSEGEADKEELKLERQADESVGKRIESSLGFAVAAVEAFERPENGWETRAASGNKLGDSPNWYSQYRFDDLETSWGAIVEVDDQPVVIERPLGKGSVVIASDSFFVSNEALHREASPGILTWILGDKTNVIFDETIHGSEESGGTMKLIRQYRLHGVFVGLIVFIVLWAWRSSSTLAPSSEELDLGLVDGSGAVAGEETSSGLILLLRRSVSSPELIRRCVEVWRQSSSTGVRSKELEAVERLVNEHEEAPKKMSAPAVYREIVEVLRRR